MTQYVVTDYGVEPNSEKLQTATVQAVLDRCKNDGGQVVFPAGEYIVSSLFVYSNTQIYLCSGAKIIGSDEFSDYVEIDIAPHFNPYHDYITLAPQCEKFSYFAKDYCYAMFASVGQKNISYVFEDGSYIDGRHCFNINGDQNYRGPHTIWMTACENLRFDGVTIERSGNFAFQLDSCSDIALKNATVRRGDDGIHLNGCKDIVIENSSFETGDDCIAGLNIVNLLVKDCYVNSACDCFRLGGKNIHILNSRMIGPGKYPHRVSTAKGKNIELPDSDGRRNTNVFFCFFATEVYPMDSENIVIENCEISGVDRFLYDSQEFCVFQTGGIIKDFTLKNVTVNGLKEPSLYNTKTLFRFENLNADDENKYLILPKQQ